MMDEMTKGTLRTKILSLREITWWWLGDALHDRLREDEGLVWADLPPIQRGFVWHANKIERLWDSIATGFPIGSLMLQLQQAKDPEEQPPMGQKVGANDDLGSRRKKKEGEQPYLLLDGQQRATSIALGFKDVWTNPSKTNQKGWRALWVDIGRAPTDDRLYLFRVTSTAHPWGYKDNAAATSGPGKLSVSDMRAAHMAFKACLGKDQIRPYEVPAHIAFPWDADAPVPLAFILQVLMEYPAESDVNIRSKVWEKVISLNMMTRLNEIPKDAADKFRAVKDILTGKNENTSGIFDSLAEGLRNALEGLELPAPVLNTQGSIAKILRAGDEEKNDDNDAAYNLFARINTAGTPLTREEINYSLLKSIWADASKTIDKALAGHQITYPARLASLLTRLVLTELSEESKEPLVRDALSIAQFRKVIAENKEFTCKVNEPLNSGIVECLWMMLAEKSQNASWTLPPILAVDITRHNEDLALIAMLWLRKLGLGGLGELDEASRRRTLGFITAVQWFAHDGGTCAKTLGKSLLTVNADEIGDFFNKARFATLLESSDRKPAPMPRLPTPDQFRALLHSARLAPSWPSVWHLYFATTDNEKIETFKKYQNQDAAHTVLRGLISDRRLLMYAQRKFIKDAFSWFDPTQVERVTDHNVPWDFDHIVPKAWFDGRSYDLGDKANTMKIWMESNGNYRLWPAEANRSKGDSVILEENLEDYELQGIEAVCEQSAIPVDSEFLKISKMNSKTFFENRDQNFETYRRAAIERTVSIYQTWFDELRIGDLCDGIAEISSPQ